MKMKCKKVPGSTTMFNDVRKILLASFFNAEKKLTDLPDRLVFSAHLLLRSEPFPTREKNQLNVSQTPTNEHLLVSFFFPLLSSSVAPELAFLFSQSLGAFSPSAKT